MSSFGLLPPPDRNHLDKYPLRLAKEFPTGPMAMGLTWYESFSEPLRAADGAYWIGIEPGNLGRPLGGHAVCLLPWGWRDLNGAWETFDQGQTSECVGFSTSRLMGLLNRVTYHGSALYAECKKRDGIPNEDGTYLRVAFDVLRELGPWRRRRDGAAKGPLLAHGITENRWTESVEEAATWLGMEKEYLTILNSWGTGWPREVRIPLRTLEALMRREDAYLELGAVTDRPGPKKGSST